MNFKKINTEEEFKEALTDRKKNAINVVLVKYVINGNETTINNPEVVKMFLERFQKLEIPNDPVFGPQAITLTKGIWINPGVYHVHKDLSIFEYAGKSILYKDNLYFIPTLDEMNNEGFGHLQKGEERDKIRRKEELEMAKRMKILYKREKY